MTGFQKHLAMWGVLGVVVLLVGVWVADFNSDQPAPIALDDATAETFITLDEQVHFVCSHCHAYPQPETLPRRAWHKELRIAYGFIGKSDLDPSLVPELDHVVDYYESRAPDALPFPTVLESDQTPPRIFVERPLSGLSDVFYQGVAHVEWFASAEPASFAPGLACDMRNGHILTWNSLSNTPTVRLLAEVGHPVHAVPCDLDGDGNGDLIVADIGSIMPTNEKTGRVVWLRTTVDGNHEPIVLAENLGRVADVRVADFDADGDHDLIVAVFGWHRNGQLLYLENNTRDYQQPQFHANMLDDRTGAIHVPITDLNNDGLPDFVALLSQEHEQVLAFLNMGNGEFRRELLFDAGNPSYGSSGIRLADLDQDGDVDVLLCNGDTLDLTIYKPYHSVQWLENEGGFPFRHHHLAQLPGAFQTAVGDLDLDGDSDIVAVAFLPGGLYQPNEDPLALVKSLQLPSMIWLEQTEPGTFHPHSLETARCCHPCVDLADVDADGDLDIITANCTLEGFPGFPSPAKFPTVTGGITIWENREFVGN